MDTFEPNKHTDETAEGLEEEDARSSVSCKTCCDTSSVFYNDPTLIKVASMPYRNFRVSIYKKTGGANDLFYYEPIVSLDPKSIIIHRGHAHHQFQVSFTVELWNTNLEKRIINYLRNDAGIEQLKDSHVQVMPYEQVQLVVAIINYDDKTAQFQLPGPKSYLQQNGSLDFDVSCDSKDAADLVANEKFLSNHLALVFKSPTSGENLVFHHGSQAGVKRVNRFGLNIVRDIGGQEEKNPFRQSKRNQRSNLLSRVTNFSSCFLRISEPFQR